MAFICPKEPAGDGALLMHRDKAQVQKEEKEMDQKCSIVCYQRNCSNQEFPHGTIMGLHPNKNQKSKVLLQKIQQRILKSDLVRV